MPLSLAAFTLGVVYGAWTAVQQSRIPNGAVLLLMFAVIVFLVGLVSEQISTLHFARRGGTAHECADPGSDLQRAREPADPRRAGPRPRRHAHPRAGRRLTRWHRPDRRRARATVSGAPRRHASYRSTRPGTVLSRRVSHGDRERRRRRVPDGRRPVTRSEVPAVADRGHGGRRISSSARATSPAAGSRTGHSAA